jgi:hypothetical protein
MFYVKVKQLFLSMLLYSLYSLNAVIAQDKSNSEKPNIIFILTDDQRFDAIGYAGNKFVQTPEMDDLAKRGLNPVDFK